MVSSLSDTSTLGAKYSVGGRRPQVFLTCLSWHGMKQSDSSLCHAMDTFLHMVHNGITELGLLGHIAALS